MKKKRLIKELYQDIEVIKEANEDLATYLESAQKRIRYLEKRNEELLIERPEICGHKTTILMADGRYYCDKCGKEISKTKK